MPLAVAQTPTSDRSGTTSGSATSLAGRSTRTTCDGLPDYLLMPSNQDLISHLDIFILNFRLTREWPYRGDKINKLNVLGLLNGLRAFPEGWNGYDAAPIDPGIIRAAERFISDMPSDIVPAPQVVPMTRGRVQFEWHRGDRSLELEFENPEFVHYLKWDSDAGIEEEDILPVQQHGKILDLLKWFSEK